MVQPVNVGDRVPDERLKLDNLASIGIIELDVAILVPTELVLEMS